MIDLHPVILRKDGKEQFAILTWDEFVRVREALEDAEDLLALRIAKAEDDPSLPGISLDEMKRRIDLRFNAEPEATFVGSDD